MKKLIIIIPLIIILFIIIVYGISKEKSQPSKYFFIEKANGNYEDENLSQVILLSKNDIDISLTKFNLTSNSLDYTIETSSANEMLNIDFASIKFDSLIYDENYNLISEYVQTGNQIATIFFEENKNEINMNFDDFYNKFQNSKMIEENSYIQDTLLNFSFDENSKTFNFSRIPIKEFESSNTYFVRIYNLNYDYFDTNKHINTVNLSNQIFEFEINKK